jgi:nicotinamidase-related amidase
VEHGRISRNNRLLPAGWRDGLCCGHVQAQAGSVTRNKRARAEKTMGAKPMNPQTTAIVLIEYQNDFTSPGGVFHDGVKDVMQSNNMLANTVEVANRCRAAGVTVMHAPISFAEGYGELTGNPYGILKGVVDNKAFRKGSWGAEIVDVLAPRPEDIVVEGKRGLDAFPSTNLDFILRSKGIRTIALGGFLTNCCVESTMRSAYERGFDVITLKDCTATLSQEAQDMALTYNFGMFSRPMNHDEFLKLLA